MLATLVALAALAITQSAPTDGTFVDIDVVRAASDSNSAWTDLKNYADDAIPGLSGAATPSLVGNDNDTDDTRILARALVWLRSPSYTTGTYNNNYAEDVEEYVVALYGTEDDCDDENESSCACDDCSDGLRAQRSVFAYVSAFEMVWLGQGGSNTPISVQEHGEFLDWVEDILATTFYDGRTFEQTADTVPNNVGLFCSASMLACEIVLVSNGRKTFGDSHIVELKNNYHGWCGNTLFEGNFNWATSEWHASPGPDVNYGRGINQPGSTFDASSQPSGSVSSGCMPEEQRRVDSTLTWPPSSTDYSYEALEAVTASMLMLERCGYSVYTTQTNAVERAVDWLLDYDGFGALDDNNYWMLATLETKYDRGTDWTNGLSLGNYSPGRAIIGMEWILGY